MIFVDRSIPRSVAEALKLVRSDVRWLEDEFAHDVPDADWLREIGSREWLVIGRDRRIRYRPAERQAILDHRVGYFCIAQDANPTRWAYLRLIVTTLDQMEQLFATVERPFIYGVYKEAHSGASCEEVNR